MDKPCRQAQAIAGDCAHALLAATPLGRYWGRKDDLVDMLAKVIDPHLDAHGVFEGVGPLADTVQAIREDTLLAAIGVLDLHTGGCGD